MLFSILTLPILLSISAQQQPQSSSRQYFSPQCHTPGNWEGGKIQKRGKKAKREEGGDSSDLMTFREDSHLCGYIVDQHAVAQLCYF